MTKGGFIACVVLAVLLVANLFYAYSGRDQAGVIERKLDLVLVQQRATQVAVAFVNTRLDVRADKVFCAGGGSPLCQALTFKDYHNLTRNNDLWVALDAAAVLQASPLSGERARELIRRYTDLTIELARYDALPRLLEGDAMGGDQLYATTLYFGVLAQAAVCRQMPAAGTCVNGLPVGVARALRNLLVWVRDNGPRANAYEMSFRQPSVQAVLEGLLAKAG